MTDIVQIIIQIQKKQSEIKNLKGLTKFVYENLNPREINNQWVRGVYGVLGSEIIDFLMMYGLDQENSEKLLGHMDAQALLKRVHSCIDHRYMTAFRSCVYIINFKD